MSAPKTTTTNWKKLNASRYQHRGMNRTERLIKRARIEPDLVIDDEGECPMHEGGVASFRKPMVWHANRAQACV